MTRPNRNPILAIGMAWAYGVVEVLYDADPNMVPGELEYRPSIAGPDLPGDPEFVEGVPYETVAVWEYLHNADAMTTYADDLPYWSDPTFSARADELRTAALCLHRYITWTILAGRDY